MDNMNTSTRKENSPNGLTSCQPRQANAPQIVGIYGLPGSGKTYMLNELRKTLPPEQFLFFDGSKVINDLVPGGLEVFRELKHEQQSHWRETAMESIQRECSQQGHLGVVAGHFMFWTEGAAAGTSVCTPKDLSTYTHIVYLDVPVATIAQRCSSDKTRERPTSSIEHLKRWQEAEKSNLRRLCRDNGILLSILASAPTSSSRMTTMLRDFQKHSEQYNALAVERDLDHVALAGKGQLRTMLVLDADRTLAPQDTGKIFWKELADIGIPLSDDDPLKVLFSSPLKYSYTAFRQATLLYEDAADDTNFEALCDSVARKVDLHPEFEYLLRKTADTEHVGAVIVTCGLRRLWEKVLQRYGLAKSVNIIGGGRIADGLVVTENVKGAVVQRLRTAHRLYVWAFGDSPLDLKMCAQADQAVIVVGDEQNRSATMDHALLTAIKTGGLKVRQALLPRHASPRLDTNMIPQVELMDVRFLESIFGIRHTERTKFQLVHATMKKAASLLMTPMRDSGVAGPVLRECHRRVGQYLAIEYLTESIGLEQYPIPHVQGHSVSGFRLHKEESTLIVALMRGGEPMALGISDVLPLASFLHASRPSDMKEHHLRGIETVILVDSVVNSGKTILEFVGHTHSLSKSARIVVAAGVVQAEFVSASGPIHELALLTDIKLVALRLSDNKFKGRGGTDTGNRLFNTTMLK